MSYKIRYGYDSCGQIPTKRILRMQMILSALLLFLTGLARFWSEGAQLLEPVLSAQPITVTERAVYALSGELARGEGWYQALTVWCRTIIYEAAV